MIWGLGGAVPRPRRDGASRAEEALSSRGFACGAGTGGGDGAESPYEAAAGRVSGSDGSTQGREGIGAVRRSERGELHEGGGRVAEHPHGAGGLSAVICFSDSGGGAARRGAARRRPPGMRARERARRGRGHRPWLRRAPPRCLLRGRSDRHASDATAHALTLGFFDSKSTCVMTVF